MKTITLDVINQTAVSETAEGDVGVKLVVNNAPEEWEKCSVFALFTQGEQTRHELIKNPNGEYNVTTVPSAFTDANKAFKIGVYAVGAGASRDVRPSVWIRVMDTDFTTEDLVVTSQTMEDVLALQTLYTEYEKAESERVKAEEKRNQDFRDLIDRIDNLPIVERDVQNTDEYDTMYPEDVGGCIYHGTYANYGKYFLISLRWNEDVVRIYQYLFANLVHEFREIVDGNVGGWQRALYDTNVSNTIKSDHTSDGYTNSPVNGRAVAGAISQLVGSAPDTLNTLEELADALKDNADIVDVLNEAIAGKADKINGYGLVSVGSVNAGDANKRWYVLSLRKSDNIGSGWTGEVYSKSAIDYNLNLKVDKIDGYGLVNVSRLDDKIVIGSSGEAYLFYDAVAVDDLLTKKVDTTEYKQFKNDLSQGNFEVLKAVYANTAQDATNAMNDWDGNDIQQTYAKIRPDVITDIPDTFSPNQTYHLYEVPSSIVFPSSDIADGDAIYITFMTGETAPTVKFVTTNTTDIDIKIKANTGYEIYGKYVANIGKWIVGYSEYTVTKGESV